MPTSTASPGQSIWISVKVALAKHLCYVLYVFLSFLFFLLCREETIRTNPHLPQCTQWRTRRKRSHSHWCSAQSCHCALLQRRLNCAISGVLHSLERRSLGDGILLMLQIVPPPRFHANCTCTQTRPCMRYEVAQNIWYQNIQELN